MTEVKRLLLELLGDDEQLFVFPSEVAADFWRRECLKLSGRRAIWEDRFLSWDRFKEATFQLSQRAAPVNRVIRMLFAATLLDENRSGEPVFTSLVGSEYSESSPAFLKTITGILPELKRYRDVMEGARRTARPGEAFKAVDEATRIDLELLWKRYHAFLEDNGLFEPSYDRIDVSALKKHYHVFFPEVIEDWKEALPFLDSHHIHPVSAAEPPARPVIRYENSVQEMRSLLRELSLLLGGGTDPADIAITVPRLEAWESFIRRDTELAGIPIDIRQGRTLAEYPETRLFFRLSECHGSGYTIDALKRLFLCRAYPWRHRRAGESLVRWGIEHHCAGRYGIQEIRDPWEEKLGQVGAGNGSAAADARSLLDFYTGFSREVSALVRARSFGDLRNRLQRFIKSWLDTEEWASESRRIFQFALDALNDLIEAHGRIEGIKVADSYSLWLATLGERLYVQRSGTAGIPVYPYRVSAGIAPAHHFVLGATQIGTQVDWRPLSFLREDERNSLGVEDASATEAFLRLYLSSGGKVVMSFSDQDVAGVELPPGYFVMRGAVERSVTLDVERDSDPYLIEAAVWSGLAAPPARAYRIQREGAGYFSRVGMSLREGDLTVATLESSALRERLTQRLCDESGRLEISPTRLDRFWACAYGFLLSTALSVDERSFTIEWTDPRAIGSLMHEVVRRIFLRIKDLGGRFEGQRIEEYRKILAEELDTSLEEWELRGESFSPPVWNSLRIHLRERLSRLLEEEAERFSGFRVEAIETEYAVEGETRRLKGRIDRVSADDDDGMLLVDYKRTDRVKRRDLRVDDEDAGGEEGPVAASGRPTTFQIPFYVKLIEAQGRPVKTAAYYAIEKAKYDVVFDEDGRKAWLRREELERLLASTENAIRVMELRVRGGAWMVPDLRSGCEECRFRSICRMKYSVR